MIAVEKQFSKFRLWCKPTARLTQDESVGALSSFVGDDTEKEKVTPAVITESSPKRTALLVVENAVESQTNFLSLFGLVTSETSQVLLKKSQERKKRSCSSPHFMSLLLKAEKQDLDGNDVRPKKRKGPSEVMKKRDKSTSSPVPFELESTLKIKHLQAHEENSMEDYHEELCHVCSKVGELLLCDTCPFVYHRQCAQLADIPQGKWFCQLCQVKLLNNYEVPSVTEEDIKHKYKELKQERIAQLKLAYSLRTEKADLQYRINEVICVLESKEKMERTFIEKIEQSRQLKDDVDLFLAEL